MKKIISLTLALVLMLLCVSAPAETVKHERVFAVAGAEGEISTLIDSVRLENGDGLKEIADRTQLTDIENVGGHEAFTLNGEELVWQADGNSIRYQGKGTKAPAVTPVVTYTLNGSRISAQEAADARGELTMTVTYKTSTAAPCLVISVLPVPDGMKILSLENAAVLDEGVTPLIAGIAVTGLDKNLSLPDSFSVVFDADRPALSWMMTAAASDPLKALTGKLGEKVQTEDLEALLNEGIAALTALSTGQPVPATEGKLQQLAETVNELLDGTASLASGASRVNGGVLSAQKGAGDIVTGLNVLTGNNDSLNAGAAQIFDAILQSANAQLSASGREIPGIGPVVLTADNYAGVLDAAVAALQDAVDHAEDTARAQVTAAVEAQDETIRLAAGEAVKGQVLTTVLASAGLDMDAETYAAALDAGMIPEEQAARISAAVDEQAASDSIREQLESAVVQQKAALVEQYMASDEVQAQLAASSEQGNAAIASLTGLKMQLDSVHDFVTGLAEYTDGVAQAKAGAEKLKTGIDTLADGAAQLNTGASTLSTKLHIGTIVISANYLPLLKNEVSEGLRMLKETFANIDAAEGYDLTADGIAEDTIYIIRTTLNR